MMHHHSPVRSSGFYDPRTYDMRIGSSEGRDERIAYYLATVGRSGSRVLEIGSGTGEISLQLASLGVCVTAVDPSMDCIQFAAGKASSMGLHSIRWVVGKIEDLDFSDSEFDSIIAPAHVLCHILDDLAIAALFGRMYGWLRSNGLLVADFPCPPRGDQMSTSRTTTGTIDGTYEVEEMSAFWSEPKILSTSLLYTLRSGLEVSRWSHNFIYRLRSHEDLATQMVTSGFRDVRLRSPVEKSSPPKDTEDFILLAQGC